MVNKHRNLLVFVILMASIVSCQNNPEAIDYGHDDCAHCRMVISDRKFGAELITQKGKIYKFDSIECMASYYRHTEFTDVQSLWTIDFSNPVMWVKADGAYYLQSKNLPSPMGMFLSSFANRETAEAMRSQMEGNLLNWQEVMSLVAKK
ncbi:nitrous oxide reductase accessory protein NosL [bacterium]|nr:nitrous oxide reductase accessory protein NosL [bacterium]